MQRLSASVSCTWLLCYTFVAYNGANVCLHQELHLLHTINIWLSSEEEKGQSRPAWNLLPWGVSSCRRESAWVRDFWTRMTCSRNVFWQSHKDFSLCFTLSCRAHSCNCNVLAIWLHEIYSAGVFYHCCSSSCSTLHLLIKIKLIPFGDCIRKRGWLLSLVCQISREPNLKLCCVRLCQLFVWLF